VKRGNHDEPKEGLAMDATKMSKLEFVIGEREFLHEISTPLMVALGLTEKLEDLSSSEGNEVLRLHQALNKVAEALKERRQNLLQWTQELEKK
jgi:hypothetical protein